MTPLSFGHLPQGGELRFGSFLSYEDCAMHTISGAKASPLGEVGGVALCLQAKVNALRGYQSATGEELRPLFGRTLLPSHRDAAQSVLRPQGGAFKGEL